jgi:hypothetical protein
MSLKEGAYAAPGKQKRGNANLTRFEYCKYVAGPASCVKKFRYSVD